MIPGPIEFEPALSKQNDSLEIGASVTSYLPRVNRKTI